MSRYCLRFNVHEAGRTTTKEVSIGDVVVAGWTGRDPVARDRHIAELEALGVARPASTPIYYRIASNRLSTRELVEVSGEHSSGEVEFVLIRFEGRLYVGVGSDHTDRRVEAYNVTVSKQMCDKPLAPELWPFDEVEPHWDRLVLRSFATVDGKRDLYQEGTLEGILPPKELMERGFGTPGLPEGTAMFGGTFAARGGIRPASRFEYEIDDPMLGRTIAYGYDVRALPILG